MKDIHNKQRRHGFSKWRALSLFLVYLLIGLHIAYWKLHGSALAPLEFNEVLYTIHLGIITAGFIFMVMTFLGTLIFGRFFCSWGCHILAMEDISTWILQKFKIHPKPVRSRVLIMIPTIAMIYLFIWPQIVRIINHEPLPAMRILEDKDGWASFITTDFWRNLPGIEITLLTFFFSGFFIIYLLGSRSFCRYVCPYAAVFTIADRFAPGQIKLTGSCDQCGLCTAHCWSHIQVHKELAEFGSVVNPQCLKDLDCVQICPKEAIKFGFGKPSILKLLKKRRDREKVYDFSFGEDLFLAFSILALFLIFRGLYDKVPFLLAITIAVSFSFMFLMAVQLFRFEFVRISDYVLKQGNKFTLHGKIFAIGSMGILSLVLHSAFIHYHAYNGKNIYEYLMLLESKKTIIPKSKKEVIDKVESGLYHLELADKYGIYSSDKLVRQLVSLYIYKKNYSRAELLLRAMVINNPEDMEARLRLAKIFKKTDKKAEALKELEGALSYFKKTPSESERKWLAQIHFMAGNINEQDSSCQNAIQHYIEAINMDSTSGHFYLTLSNLYLHLKFPDLAEKVFNQGSYYLSDKGIVHLHSGKIYLAQNKIKEAIDSFQAVLQLQPSNAEAHYCLGFALYKNGQIDIAAEHIKTAAELKAEHERGEKNKTK
ncbi:MAG: tetratricopeptide repeat protein [Bacteroidetes bacterium]|nr:MAG: tetratricopeptide repeat protein [Bacteroidota bacterium]